MPNLDPHSQGHGHNQGQKSNIFSRISQKIARANVIKLHRKVQEGKTECESASHTHKLGSHHGQSHNLGSSHVIEKC